MKNNKPNIDLTQPSVLTELVQDLELRLEQTKIDLEINSGYGADSFSILKLATEVKLLEEILERVEAQDELIHFQKENICLN